MALVIILILFFIYEYHSGFMFNKKVKPCPTCEHYNVSSRYDDNIQAAALLSNIDKKIETLVHHLKSHRGESDTLADNIERVIRNYDSDKLYEIPSDNILGRTSFIKNKSIIVLCLRNKQNGELHDENTLIFVLLHELAHMMNEKYGHGADFWTLFKFLLECATEINIYNPVDYNKKNVVYCGLNIEYSPLFAN